MGNENRTRWSFMVPTATLLEAAEAKLAHHTERLAHWTARRDAALERVKSEGISVDERLDLSRTTSYVQETVRVDPDLERALREAQAKVHQHQDLVDVFRRFVYGFRLELHLSEEDPTRNLRDCTVDDLDFFGLARTE